MGNLEQKKSRLDQLTEENRSMLEELTKAQSERMNSESYEFVQNFLGSKDVEKTINALKKDKKIGELNRGLNELNRGPTKVEISNDDKVLQRIDEKVSIKEDALLKDVIKSTEIARAVVHVKSERISATNNSIDTVLIRYSNDMAVSAVKVLAACLAGLGFYSWLGLLALLAWVCTVGFLSLL